jgi:hypothetical protein
MELKAHALHAPVVIRQMVERKLQQQQRKLGVNFAVRATLENQMQMLILLLDVSHAPLMQSLLRNHLYRVPRQQLLPACALSAHMLKGSQPTPLANARIVQEVPQPQVRDLLPSLIACANKTFLEKHSQQLLIVILSPTQKVHALHVTAVVPPLLLATIIHRMIAHAR